MVEMSNDGLDASFERNVIRSDMWLHIRRNQPMSIFEVILFLHFFNVKPSLIVCGNSLQRCDGSIDFSERWKGDLLFMPAILACVSYVFFFVIS